MLHIGQSLRSRDPAVEARQRWPKAVVGYAVDYAAGHTTGRHAHERAQLVHGEKGVMTVRTDDGAWVVPPGYAVWVPPGVFHEVRAAGAVAMRTLYLREDSGVPVASRCRVVRVPPLARELIARVVRLPEDYPGEPVTAVALDLGYESPSAFIAMFRRALGAPPTRYLRYGGDATQDLGA